MPDYELRVDTDSENKIVRLKLRGDDGSQAGSNEIELAKHRPALWEGLFDTRSYIRRYEGSLLFEDQQEPATAEFLLRRLGEFLGQQVLGEGIFRKLAEGGRKSLVVRLPTASEDLLGAAFARVPWEIARWPEGTGLRNLVVRAVASKTPGDTPRPLAEGEALRVLAVFAEAPGSLPLAMRLEREQLRRMFAEKILPRRNVELDILCHGVTRRRLKEAVRSRNGYHVVHWSGHGHHDALELQGEKNNQIDGEALVGLFVEAGGFVPQIFFLSACHSGSMLRVRDWKTLREALEREDEGDGGPPEKEAAVRQLDDAIRPERGYTGTALALLRFGVAQVVAMRYAVGDEYARKLGLAFYGRLLGDPETRGADEALAAARGDVLEDPEQSAHHAVDHATPLMFGRPGRLLDPIKTRSPQMERLRPRPQPLLEGGRTELDPPASFVGRGGPLTRLGNEWLGPEGPAVCLVQGLAGLGKTVLAAEAVHLWHPGFDYTLAFQAKPEPLQLDDFHRRIDQRLTFESPSYRTKCDANPYRRVYLEHDPKRYSTPAQRLERMRDNLVELLRDEAVLLVLDNFENNLEEVETTPGSSLRRCKDPNWDALLGELARRLPGTRSRLLATSRHRLAALSERERTLWIPLGPLPVREAGLYLRSRDELRKLLFGDESAQALARRLLEISRGHPLILDRFARLAADPAALAAALDRVESEGWKELPGLFAAETMDEKEREAEIRYLEDVAVGSVDLLIERLTPDARRLLWVVTLANEPVSGRFVEGVWSGRSAEDEEIEKLRPAVLATDALPDDDPRKSQHLALMATEEGQRFMEKIRAPSPETDAPPVGPLMEELRGSGLLTREDPARPEADASALPEEHRKALEALMAGRETYGFHEMVRQRIGEWMSSRPAERPPRGADEIRTAYGERYAAAFDELYHIDRDAAGEAGRRALVYFVAAGAYDRLGGFASRLVTGVESPGLLRGVVAELEGAIERAPPGRTRWSLRSYVADALRRSGRPDRALPFYVAAAGEAETAGHWADAAWITGNWAFAARDTGDLEEAKRLHLRSADAERRAGRPEVGALSSELEALRIDAMRGGAERALPEIESRLDRVRQWWRRAQSGGTVAEAPDRTVLGRALVGGLDIALQANLDLERWRACLDLLQETESVKRALGENEVGLARTRFNRYGPLLRLGELDEAQGVLEGCLDVFRSAGDAAREAGCLSGLAHVWDERGDPSEAAALERRALAVRNALPDPSDRAISHGNLGNYLEKMGRASEAGGHHLAAGSYWLATGRGDHLATWVGNLGVRARRALAEGRRFAFPRLEETLAQPEFDALRRFLEGRGIDHTKLQTEIDRLVEQAHQPQSPDQNPSTGLPPEIDQLVDEIFQAASQGQDVEPLLDRLRDDLLKRAGAAVDPAQIDAVLDSLRSGIAAAKSGRESAQDDEPEG